MHHHGKPWGVPENPRPENFFVLLAETTSPGKQVGWVYPNRTVNDPLMVETWERFMADEIPSEELFSDSLSDAISS